MNYRELWFANNESDHGWYICAACGKKIRKADADIDHIVPQKYGGEDKLYNLQCLCKHCNRSKQASMKDTLPDLYTTNKNRAVKAVKKNAAFVKKKVVEGAKSVAQSVVNKVRGDDKSKDSASKKTTTTAKKDSTTKKTTTTAKKDTTTKKTTTTAKKDTTTKKTTTTAKKDTTTKKDTATKKTTATAKKDTATKKTTTTNKKDTATAKKEAVAKKTTTTAKNKK